MSCDVGEVTESLENEQSSQLQSQQSSFSSLSVTSPTLQLILQPFRRFTYVTAHSPTLSLLHLRHSSFSNSSFASPTSQALHLRHLEEPPISCTFLINIYFHCPYPTVMLDSDPYVKVDIIYIVMYTINLVFFYISTLYCISTILTLTRQGYRSHLSRSRSPAISVFPCVGCTVPYISLSPAQPKVARPACLHHCAAVPSACSCVFFVIKL